MQRRARGRYLALLSAGSVIRSAAIAVESNKSAVASAPSWAELAAMADATATGMRLQAELAAREHGGGPPHTDAKLRLFGQSKEDVRVTSGRGLRQG